MTSEEEDKTILHAETVPDRLWDDTEKTRFESPIQSALESAENTIVYQSTESGPHLGPASEDKTAFLQNTAEPVQVGLGVGDVLKRRFKIIECLGQGGMGMVFKALDIRKVEAKSHNPFVAIKVLNPALAQNELLVAGLQRECEKAQELSHPNIITVYDFDRDGDLVYMFMEFLSGQPLNEIIRMAAPIGGISLKQAWPFIRDMATALAYAHKRNIVHSDFKPANVIITQDQKVKVLDFGIASRTEKDQGNDATIFNARAEGGHTPTYASFEMMNGAKADPRDDIYAFGLVVYEMLTGRHPYNRKPASEVFIEQQKTGKSSVKPVKGLSWRQWQALKSAIEILQDKRPKNLEDWLQQFDPKAGRWSQQMLGGGVAVVLLLGSYGVNLWLSAPAKTTSAPDANQNNSPTPMPQPPRPVEPVFQLPVANAGGDQSAKPGQAVVLDGSQSQSGDGAGLTYAWRMLELPAGSLAKLENATAANTKFIPDKSGEYIIALTVRDGNHDSLPIKVRVRVTEPVQLPESLHKASSPGGQLSLSASKAKYRIGEQLKLNLSNVNAGYVRVAYIGANGDVSELLPNPHQASKVKANTEYVIPPKGKFKLEITGPVGVDKIIAVYSPKAISSLEKLIDANGDIDTQSLPDSDVVSIRYDVVK